MISHGQPWSYVLWKFSLHNGTFKKAKKKTTEYKKLEYSNTLHKDNTK